MRRYRLRDLAHSRAGDKGNISTISLIPYDKRWYPILQEVVTSDWVHANLGALFPETVVRYELPKLPALLFIGHRPPMENVTISISRDAHGKSFSQLLLGLHIESDRVLGAPPGATKTRASDETVVRQ